MRKQGMSTDAGSNDSVRGRGTRFISEYQTIYKRWGGSSLIKSTRTSLCRTRSLIKMSFNKFLITGKRSATEANLGGFGRQDSDSEEETPDEVSSLMQKVENRSAYVK